MKDFLDHIVDGIREEDLSSLGRWWYVFPSKRAGVFFLDKLRSKFPDQTYWSPEVLGVEDFVYRCARRDPSDEITLVFRLFDIYRKLEPDVEFERFYAWGQVLLADFDEVDRYLVDTDRLYDGLAEITNLEEAFGDNEELAEAYERFAELFIDQQSTELMRRFKANWKSVAKAYREFSDWAEDNDTYYPGKIFRELSERLEDSSFALPFEKVKVAGFNALSASEEKIFLQLLDRGVAEVFWDCDKLYMEDDQEEAGDFLRKYKRTWPRTGVQWITSDFSQEKKEINTVGCPQLVAQAKYTGRLLRTAGLDSYPDTAVILGDENLLMPVVHSIDAGDINVTMGYPFRYTAMYGFISHLLLLHAEARESETGVFRSKTLLQLLKNTLVNPVFSRDTSSVSEWIRSEKLKWVKPVEVATRCKDPAFAKLFASDEVESEILERINEFLVRLFYYIKDEGNDETSGEIVYHALKLLSRFGENLMRLPVKPTVKFLQLCFQESARSWKIPFSGEPLEGIQVMGFLESRALDFKNVVILGANENRIPKSTFGTTYIPFVARKAFGLPTFEEHEAIYAYHFKRVLQRASNAYILYDTEVAVDGSGEKSRFLLQLERKLQGTPLTISDRIVHLPFKSLDVAQSSIEIPKTEALVKKLDKYLQNGVDTKSRLSPSKLVNYIDCSLRFYFKEIAKIPEDDPSMDEIDPRMFGIVLHKALEDIYRPFVGKEIHRGDLEALDDTKVIRAHIDDAMREFNVVHPNYNVAGKDLLLVSVLVRLVRKIIQRDKQDAPLTILAVEKFVDGNIEVNGSTIALGGIVDRIDQIESKGDVITRIIDYKTGRVEMLPRYRAQAPDPEDYFVPYFSEGKYKSGFQAYFYASLYHREHPGANIKAGVYELRRASRGTEFLRRGEVLSDSFLNVFQQKLQALVGEVFSKSEPFRQTEDLSKCRFCAYKTICQRDS